MSLPEFREFASIPRLSRPCIITEKIDGTNGVVFIGVAGCLCGDCDPRGDVAAGSRTRWITPEMDNHGFAAWVRDHADELRALGPGRHFGEWWGQGVNKRYPMIAPKRFSLFNVHRWRDTRPACCHVVPVLYEGPFTTEAVEGALLVLDEGGSVAAPGCTRPEGVVVFHVPSQTLFKKTLEKDEAPKSVTGA